MKRTRHSNWFLESWRLRPKRTLRIIRVLGCTHALLFAGGIFLIIYDLSLDLAVIVFLSVFIVFGCMCGGAVDTKFAEEKLREWYRMTEAERVDCLLTMGLFEAAVSDRVQHSQSVTDIDEFLWQFFDRYEVTSDPEKYSLFQKRAADRYRRERERLMNSDDSVGVTLRESLARWRSQRASTSGTTQSTE